MPFTVFWYIICDKFLTSNVFSVYKNKGKCEKELYVLDIFYDFLFADNSEDHHFTIVGQKWLIFEKVARIKVYVLPCESDNSG